MKSYRHSESLSHFPTHVSKFGKHFPTIAEFAKSINITICNALNQLEGDHKTGFIQTMKMHALN